ncbi:hypothetical protein C8R47DRAFT_1302405 [Mycena vitilis]|nr:hypothetical protein C8R47DRAFT_1302405 [Mycena vitilis]
MAIELSKRSKGQINSYSLHPGVIATTIVQRDDVRPDLQRLGVLGPDGQPATEKYPWKTIPQGAATTVVAAFDPSLDGQYYLRCLNQILIRSIPVENPGAYLSDCTVANEDIAPHSSDPANGERLWRISEKITGEIFVI